MRMSDFAIFFDFYDFMIFALAIDFIQFSAIWRSVFLIFSNFPNKPRSSRLFRCHYLLIHAHSMSISQSLKYDRSPLWSNIDIWSIFGSSAKDIG